MKEHREIQNEEDSQPMLWVCSEANVWFISGVVDREAEGWARMSKITGLGERCSLFDSEILSSTNKESQHDDRLRKQLSFW